MIFLDSKSYLAAMSCVHSLLHLFGRYPDHSLAPDGICVSRAFWRIGRRRPIFLDLILCNLIAHVNTY